MLKGVYFFYFHDIAEQNITPNSIRTSPARFRSELEFILNNFSVITLENALKEIKTTLEGGQKFENYHAVVCFDDAFRSVKFQGLNSLEKHKCPFTIFVNSDFALQKSVSETLLIEELISQFPTLALNEMFPDFDPNSDFKSYVKRNSGEKQFNFLNEMTGTKLLEKQPYLSLDELSDFPSELVTIGNHTARHLFMANLSKAEQKNEIKACHNVLKKLPQYRPIVALPFGSDDSYNEDTEDLMEELNGGFLIKANGGIKHSMFGNKPLFTIERIGLNNNKIRIGAHIKNRTSRKTPINTFAIRIANKMLGTSY